MRGASWSVLLGALSCSVCGVARAGEAREHDGFYLRLGGGFGWASDAMKSDTSVVTFEGTAKGFAGASEIAAGGSPFHGFVVGGGIYSVLVFAPKATNVKGETSVGQVQGEDIEFKATGFHVIAPFVDYYLDPGEGLHFQGGLGLAALALPDGKTTNTRVTIPLDQTATGFGMMLGIGDEWWVSDGWALGVLGRLTMGFGLSGDSDVVAGGKITWNHTVFAPAVLFTATMN